MGERPKPGFEPPQQPGCMAYGPLSWIVEASAFRALPLLWRGSRGKLGRDCLPELPPRIRAEAVATRVNRLWQASKASGKPSLPRVLFRGLGLDLALGFSSGIMTGVIASLCRPLILRRLVEVVTDGEPSDAILWIGLLAVALLLEGMFSTCRQYFGADMVGLSGISAISSLAQHHSSQLPSCLQDSGPSVVNLVGTDSVRLMENQKGLILVSMGVSSIVCGVVALLLTLGPMGLVGLIPMVLLLLVNAQLAHRAKDAEKRNLALVDERMHIMGQVVHGVKAVKLTAWEEKYMELLAQARARECVPLKQWRIYLQYTRQLGRANPIIASCVLFTVQALFNPEMMARPADVFAAANILMSLRLPFICLPESMAYLATMSVALKRAEGFLLLPTAESRPMPKPVPAVNPQPEMAGHAVQVEGVSFAWPDGAGSKIPSLEGLRFSAQPGEMVAIVGDVGSGKTTLLAGLLGDLRLVGGRCEVRRPLGWVPQKPFVLSGTILRNVTMGRKGDVVDALRAAALEADVDRLGGLSAEVGERGVTLSGGQAQRLALARALFGAPEVLMADDPLSAVDARSSSTIFAALEAFARGGGCLVMALNQLQLLPRFQRIIILAPPETAVVVEVKDGKADEQMLRAVKGDLGDAIRKVFNSSSSSSSSSQSKAEPAQTVLADALDEDDAKDEKKSKNDGPATQITAKDTQSTGGLKWHVIQRYLQGMGLCYAIFCLVISNLTYIVNGFADRWLAIWVADAEQRLAAGAELDYTVHVYVFIASTCAFVIGLFWTSYAFAEGGVRSSRNLHQLCLERLLHAPLTWFESMPSGRILSRFSSDVAVVDQAVAQWADNSCQLTSQLLTLVVQTLVVVPLCAVPFAAAFGLFALQTRLIQKTAQVIKRWAIDGMSPVLTTLAETQSGRQSLRAMDLSPLMTGFMHESMDRYVRCHIASQLPVDFGMVASSINSIMVACSTSVFCLLNRENMGGSYIALAMTYSFLIPYFLTMYGEIVNRFLVSLTGLERLLHYSELEQEPAWHVQGEDRLIGGHWPSKGTLEFDAVCLTYKTGFVPALNSVSFRVPGGSSLGVVGRSGAGKSSLLGLLFRLREPTSGRVLVDGVDIAKLGLQVLRRRLAILPQEPLLFPGTCRENLDPFGEHSDARLRETLAAVGLADILEGSDRSAAAGSSLAALSVGERQLLALARLMLRPAMDSQVVLFDEPTSSVDAATDQKVQLALQTRFQQSTVLTVAHRLQTVINADRILVMEAGHAVEIGPPAELIADSNSHLSSMLREAGLSSGAKVPAASGVSANLAELGRRLRLPTSLGRALCAGGVVA